jgi:hypothetical protein
VRIPEPAWLGGQHDETLSALSVARARGGSVFKIRPDQWAALLEALGGWPAREHAVAIEEMVPRAPPAAQGYGLSVRERRAIELHAMRLATEHYRRSWDEVRDVSATACFDLLCRSPGGRELHVEVKGTTTGPVPRCW